MKTTTSPYDLAEQLQTPEEMPAYLEACIDVANPDPTSISMALGDIARAKKMTEIARDAELL